MLLSAPSITSFPKLIKTEGIRQRSVKVHDGMEILIVSRMSVRLLWPTPALMALFIPSISVVVIMWTRVAVDRCCPEDQLTVIQDVVARIQSEWEEEE